MKRAHREALEILEEAGLSILDVGTRRNSHRYALVENPAGDRIKLTLANSPSGLRHWSNLRAKARRFCKTGKI